MQPPVLSVDQVSKRFRRGTASSYLRFSERLWDAALGAVRWSWTRDRSPTADSPEFWALSDVSFDVHPGEVVGVIGRNGAGKSTLLKILSRITRPTSGRVGMRGRVGSLLEVGTGFHPELTGRENIFLNGAILGMTRAQIRSRLDEIVAFAEIAAFLDTPVKRYSSGMYVRLAFAVAAHLDPEILLVDEVLAVGDYAFQRKCLGKMEDVSRSGRTVLFVSHNMTAVSGLCTRAILLEQGRLVDNGPPGEVIRRFLSAGEVRQSERTWTTDAAPGNHLVRLRAIRLIPQGGTIDRPLDVGTTFDIQIEYDKLKAGGHSNVALYLSNLQGICIFNTGSVPENLPPGRLAANVRIPGHLLNNGTHQLRIMLAVDLSPQVDVDGVLTFDVHDIERKLPTTGEWPGAVRPDLEWSVVRTADHPPTAASS